MAKVRGQYAPKPEIKFDPQNLEDRHSEAMVRYPKAFSYSEDERERVREDHCFCDEDGGQWGQRGRSSKGGYRDTKRPRLEINQVRHIRNTVVGDYRLNRIGVKIRPAGGKATEDLARLHNGIIRNQMNNSHAENSFDNAMQELATGGMGGFQLDSEYSSDAVSGLDAFDQELVVRPIHDVANSVWVDPDSIDENHRDADWMFLVREMTPMAFRDRWPDAKAGDFGLVGINGPCRGWRTQDFIRVADYYVKEWYNTFVYMYSNGEDQKVYEEATLIREGEDGEKIDVRDELEQQGYILSRTKKIQLNRVWRYKMSGSEVLEKPTLWKGRFIPLIIGYGYNGRIDGDHWYHGVVRAAKDPQRFHNYVVSAIAERCGKSVKDFYWGTPEQAANHGKVYSKANVEDRFMMPYNPDPAAPGPPVASRQATMDPNLMVMLSESATGIQRATGFSEASLGNSQERSGKAILATKSIGDLGTFILKDNFAKMIEYLGEQLIDTNPRILDKQRQIRVMEDNGKTEMVLINEEIEDSQTDQKVLLNDLSQGKYDLVRDSGPSFATKREEGVAFFQQILQTSPEMAQLMMPMMIKLMDIPYAQEFQELIDWWALKNGLRPMTAEEEEAKRKAPPPPEQIMALEQFRAEIEKKAAETDKLEIGNDETRSKIAKNYADILQIVEEARTNGIVTPGEEKVSIDAMRSLEEVLVQNTMQAEGSQAPALANPQDSVGFNG